MSGGLAGSPWDDEERKPTGSKERVPGRGDSGERVSRGVRAQDARDGRTDTADAEPDATARASLRMV